MTSRIGGGGRGGVLDILAFGRNPVWPYGLPNGLSDGLPDGLPNGLPDDLLDGPPASPVRSITSCRGVDMIGLLKSNPSPSYLSVGTVK